MKLLQNRPLPSWLMSLLQNPPPPGSGVHDWVFQCARGLKAWRGIDEGVRILSQYAAACSRTVTPFEIQEAFRSARNDWQPGAAKEHSTGRRFPVIPAGPTEDEKAALQRLDWPAPGSPGFRIPTESELDSIAALRPGVSMRCFQWLTEDGCLHIGRWKNHDVFFLSDGLARKFCQARRMDGKKIHTGGGLAKTDNLLGSRGLWLNPGGMIHPDARVILSEGCISTAELYELSYRASVYGRPEYDDPHRDVVIFAGCSAGSKLKLQHLQELRGRRVRIFPDAGDAGAAFAATNAALLRAADCTVDAVLMPEGHEDLGKALAAIPAGDPLWYQLLSF